MRESKFSLEPLGERSFYGYTRGETWNGWACPYFTFTQGEEFAKAYAERGMGANYDAASDSFSFEIIAGDGSKELDVFVGQDVGGNKLYPIGAFCWIWEEVAPG